MKKLILGVAINDSKEKVTRLVGGKRVIDPIYNLWRNMLQRCYSIDYHEKFPTYKECTVCDEWLMFSNFKEWVKTQDWNNKQLDKDILISGNKEYSPQACVFISQKLNSLLLDHRTRRGKYPIGVSYHKCSGKFIATCNKDSKAVHLGLHDTPELAFKSYVDFKSKLVAEVASEYSGDLKNSLIRISKEIIRGDGICLL